MMKKIISLALSLALLFSGMSVCKVKASTTEKEIAVNKVESVMISDPMSISDVHEWPAGIDSVTNVYKVKFTLDSTAYVKVSVNSTVCYQGYNNLGNLNNAIVTTHGGKQQGESIGSNIGTIFDKEQYEGYYLLEKGTYYVVYNGKEDDSDSEESSGKVTTTIEAQYLARTGNVTGISSSTMIPLTNNKISYGYISNLYSEQYFKFTLSKRSKVSLDMSLANTPSCFMPEITYNLFSSKGVSYQKYIQAQPCVNFPSEYNKRCRLGTREVGTNYRYPKSGSTGDVILDAGIYYLKIAQYSYSVGINAGEIIVTPHITEINDTSAKKGGAIRKVQKLKAPKLKKYKRNTKKLIGTAPKKATVKVKVGKKTYTVKVNSKGKFTVKLKTKLKKKTKIVIYSKKKGYKNSKKVTYKVK